jgi:hypothetical protein
MKELNKDGLAKKRREKKLSKPLSAEAENKRELSRAVANQYRARPLHKHELHMKQLKKDRVARNRKEKELEAAQSAEAESRRALNREAAKEYRTRQRERKYNASAIICRHCEGEGHNPIAVTSCNNYCKYCEMVGHRYETCAVRADDEVNNAHTRDDARNYQVHTADLR